jgi:hypothetical protein
LIELMVVIVIIAVLGVFVQVGHRPRQEGFPGT